MQLNDRENFFKYQSFYFNPPPTFPPPKKKKNNKNQIFNFVVHMCDASSKRPI